MNTPALNAAARTQRGLSLIECLMTLAVTAITLGTALPCLDDMRVRRHFDGAAAQLETDLYFARGLAVAQDQNMRVSLKTDAAGSCYVIHTGATAGCECNADGTATCSNGQTVMRSVGFAASGDLRLRANVSSILFDSAKGTSTPTGTLRLIGRDQRAVHLVVNIMGRVRACSPDGAVPGYKAC